MKIFYKPIFVRRYKKLPKDLQIEIKEKIEIFREYYNGNTMENSDHKCLKIHKLKGKLKNCFSFSVNYDYRIIFEYIDKNSVNLLTVGNHDIYK